MDVQLKLPELPAAPAVQTLRGVLHASISRWIKSVIMTRQVIHRANLICNCFRTESTEWKESGESSQTQIWPRLNQQHHIAFIMRLKNVSQEKHFSSSHFKLTVWPQILPGTSCIECETDGVRPGMVRGEKWSSLVGCCVNPRLQVRLWPGPLCEILCGVADIPCWCFSCIPIIVVPGSPLQITSYIVMS